MTVTETQDVAARPIGDPVLEASGVTMRFGGLLAVNDVNLTVREGEIVGLIGPNGAGKTTLVNLITGVHRPGAGEIWYGGERIDRLSPDDYAETLVRRIEPDFERGIIGCHHLDTRSGMIVMDVCSRLGGR